jgi:cell division protein FtsL
VRKQTFIIFFVIFHLGFIILQIDKQSSFIKNSYKKQRLEQEQELLHDRIQTLKQQLAELHNPETIKQFARDTLGMQPINRAQLKKLNT